MQDDPRVPSLTMGLGLLPCLPLSPYKCPRGALDKSLSLGFLLWEGESPLSLVTSSSRYPCMGFAGRKWCPGVAFAGWGQIFQAGHSASCPLEQGQDGESSLSLISRPAAGLTGPWRPPGRNGAGDTNKETRRETPLLGRKLMQRNS